VFNLPVFNGFLNPKGEESMVNYDDYQPTVADVTAKEVVRQPKKEKKIKDKSVYYTINALKLTYQPFAKLL